MPVYTRCPRGYSWDYHVRETAPASSPFQPPGVAISGPFLGVLRHSTPAGAPNVRHIAYLPGFMVATPAARQTHSPWAPFRHRTFVVIWTATLVSNIGGWMYSAAAAWLMTGLDPQPVMVSLVQVATSLPMVMF